LQIRDTFAHLTLCTQFNTFRFFGVYYI